MLMDYVDKLLSGKWKNREVCCRDIGIISPYRAQCDQIYAACCAKGYERITVGSAEVFQGQEKAVILISTVRTKGGSMGFLNDSQVSFYSNFKNEFFNPVFDDIY